MIAISRSVSLESRGLVRASCMNRRLVESVPADGSGSSNGDVPLTMPTRVSRSGIFNVQAAAYGPPPDIRERQSGRARVDLRVRLHRRASPLSVFRAELRAPEARPIWDNHADVEPVCQHLTTKQTVFQLATWRAVEIKDWNSIGGAIRHRQALVMISWSA